MMKHVVNSQYPFHRKWVTLIYFDLTVFRMYSAKNVCGFRDENNNQASRGKKTNTVK